MSWDQQAYSFGNPNAQPPTPTQTPTSGQFPSPTAFQTPRNSSNSELRGGWTPTFAEEYSVFNATPGRLTSAPPHFVETSTPRPSTASLQNRALSQGDFAAELATHVHHLSPNPNLSLPPVGPPNQLPSSPGPYSATQSHFDDITNNQVTPRKPRKRLEDAFSGQTATPPATRPKGSRKLAPKLDTDTMQNESQDSHYGASQTPTHQQSLMSFPSSSSEFFYPMSAPATAPVFTSTRPFWEPDASMGGMDLDFSPEDSSMFNAPSHRMSNSFDWGRSNQIFQETMNVPTSKSNVAAKGELSTIKRQRPLAPKLPASATELLPSTMAPFDFSNVSASEDPFSPSALGGVDPGLLFGRHNPIPMPSEFQDVPLPPARPVTSHLEFKPYQHQFRESMRDQEEMCWSRGPRESSRPRRFELGTASSPVKGSARPGLQRSISDSRGRRPQDRLLSRTSTGRMSPIKHQRSSNLMSIPEAERLRTRTEVKFTIDASGRAKTETILVADDLQTGRGGPSVRSEEWESSQYDESSSDDEPILVPSRDTSFSLPQQQPPKIGKFDASSRAHGVQRRSSAGYSQSESSSQRSVRRDSLGSEAETVINEDNRSGDAAQALRKVMKSRKKGQVKPRNPQQNRYSDSAPRRNSQYGSYSSSTNMSPTTITDPDGGATPSSTRSGTTRCVCGNSDSEGLMILCESCDNWLHADCVGVDHRSLPPVYVCAFCAQTPNLRGGRIREPAKGVSRVGLSPLAHKSFKSFR
ncbi:hypothetical protein ONS95_014854 [Cadophora gregata]|uniref:uncharacterized protein n=1 Tax=Cadophora gregata TaxID=51156 RepID=UPI0026DDA485|nr:uncharacterized protein ONS95_014854 [Cadophora gregata]KAK0113155.1 hypothetical protein ONS95_014854 [Cadophora gregata]KAK0125196.1 hypothetical protein ONS96_009055 [Cadophora gregata f. sp. sojae]